MTLQELLRKDFRLWICSALLGLALMCCTGIGEFVFGIVGIGIAISVIYKLKNISKLKKGSILDEMTKSFMIYIFIPIQIVMSLILLYWFVCDTFFIIKNFSNRYDYLYYGTIVHGVGRSCQIQKEIYGLIN